MSMPVSRHAQRGVTLFISLILLVLITLMVTTAFTLSNTNLKSVGNMQAKDEAVAAANQAIEQVLSSPFTNAPAAEEINVDFNNDRITDYVVQIAKPDCIRASKETTVAPSSISLQMPSDSWNTLWDIEATVDDPKTGAKTTVRAGARVLLTQAQKDAVCSGPSLP